YAILNSKGIISDKELVTFRSVNSRLQGHPHIVDIPEVDSTTGLLGQGLSLAIGMAIAKRNDKENNRVYAVVGDGELHEGQIWEAVMQASHYKLNNLIMIVDYNKLSSSGPVNEVINVDSISDKLKVFGFNTIEIDGNNMEQVVGALNIAFEEKEKPIAIIANTIKGKGVSYMENNPKWHSGALTDEEYEIAIRDLNKIGEGI
ncbi:transketolase, partial [Clostridium saudiense]|nr:transketolase [Clostridium saudiense]